MENKHIGGQTVCLSNPPTAAAWASVVGKLEGEGPLGKRFDTISPDSYFGQSTWEKGESEMLKQCFRLACDKARISAADLDYLLCGDLLNQCTGSAFAMKDSDVPYFGLYGACSTMAESLCLGAMLIDGGFAQTVCAATSSHFCSSERQFRFPLEYGGQRTPTAQWTVTGSGTVIIAAQGQGPYLTYVTTGKIKDKGITDVANMGAAMAPAAYDTLSAHFKDTGRTPMDYDAIFTGDLGAVGHRALMEQFAKDGYDLSDRYFDCGLLMYDRDRQGVHAGGSGCGCAASVLCGHILPNLKSGLWKRVLFSATGALLSATSPQQGLTIPGICHAIAIEAALPKKGGK